MTYAWSWSDVPGGKPPTAAVQAVIDAYQAGATLDQIAAANNTNAMRIHRTLKQAGVARRRPGRPKANA